jgi:type VI protein secretion system component VasA
LAAPSCLTHIGFDAQEAMFRIPSRGHAGFRILKEYAALPDKFRFVEISGLRKVLQGFKGRSLYLNFYFSSVFPGRKLRQSQHAKAVLRARSEFAGASIGPR